MAQGAVDTLLGRLSTLLIDEAQLLGRLRGDVQFIRDEMASMNSLIVHLTEAQHRTHHVRTWMGQVVSLARDCEAYVQLYLRRFGGPAAAAAVEDPIPSSAGISCLLTRLHRLLRLLRTIPARHQIATRIQELKVRAKDVGDRRLRYGITVPDAAAAGNADIYDGDDAQSPGDAAGEQEDLRRRAVLLEGAAEPLVDDEEVVRKGYDTLKRYLKRKDGEPRVRVFCITGDGIGLSNALRFNWYLDTLFDFTAWSTAWYVRPVLASVLEDITGASPSEEVYKPYLKEPYLPDKNREQTWLDNDEDYIYMEEKLASELRGHLKDKRFLIVNHNREEDEDKWKRLLDLLLYAAAECRPGSTIIMVTQHNRLALSSSPCKIINGRSLVQLYVSKAKELVANQEHLDHLEAIFKDMHPDAFAMKTFLHLLYVNPDRTEDELQKYRMAVSKCKRLKRSISKQVLMWCYNELHSKYRSCLLYLIIFPEDSIIRTTSLARRWVAEGLITGANSTASDETQNSTDEAEHYLDVLVTRGFISPLQTSAAGNIKSCTVHHEVREFIARVSRDINYADTTQLTDLAHHLSIHSRIGLQKSHSDGARKGIVASLPSLAASPQWKLLKVLDLMGCKGLKKKHLKSICKILLLRYLSLRNTDVTQLPKQIKELQCLETLDIRQTKVRRLAKNATVLPLLKYFLAGEKIYGSNDARRFEQSFSVVEMPLGVQKMKNMEILSHIQVSNSDSDLAAIAQLLKLRKLGVALHGKNAKLGDLLHQIENLGACLRSLSIWIDQQPARTQNQDPRTADSLHPFPNFIERLSISGITSGLIYSIKDHHQLTKVTLSETFLGENDVRILGKLRKLRGLQLLHNSYTAGSKLSFKEFQDLRSLVVDSSKITNISFENGATPNLEMIVWSFNTFKALSGLHNLWKLRKLELNGDCDQLDSVREEIIWSPGHPNYPDITHNPRNRFQEERTSVEASSSSAP